MTAEEMYQLIERVIKVVDIEDETALYSKLLWFKYVNHWISVKCAEELKIPERTFNTYHRISFIFD